MQDYDKTSLERLQAVTADLDLTAGEQRTLKWIAGWETVTVDNVAHIIEKARGTEKAGELTGQDLLQIWGYLQTLKDVFEKKARDTAQRGDTIGDKLTADYMKEITAINTMQKKLSKEAGEE